MRGCGPLLSSHMYTHGNVEPSGSGEQLIMDDANPDDDDPLAEVRRIRMEFGARFDFDPQRISEYVRWRERTSGRPVVDLSRPKEKKLADK